MKALMISDREEMILALQDEIRRSPDARYDHRLHGVLLVADGMSCRQAEAALTTVAEPPAGTGKADPRPRRGGTPVWIPPYRRVAQGGGLERGQAPGPKPEPLFRNPLPSSVVCCRFEARVGMCCFGKRAER